MKFAIIALSALAAGIVQTVTGFGSAIVMMLFFPSLMPVLYAASTSSAISLSLNAGTTWSFRKHIRWDLLVVPAVCYTLTASVVLELAGSIDAGLVLKIFGVFLMALSVYFLFFARQLRIQATPVTACSCAVLSGAASALFGIGGPPMVVYYLAALPEKEDYLGTIQAYFFFTGIYTMAYRIWKGFYTLDLLPATLIGTTGILLGMLVGKRIVNRINTDTMRKLVYVFLGITGLINLLK